MRRHITLSRLPKTLLGPKASQGPSKVEGSLDNVIFPPIFITSVVPHINEDICNFFNL